jgi:hypothetical protein
MSGSEPKRPTQSDEGITWAMRSALQATYDPSRSDVENALAAFEIMREDVRDALLLRAIKQQLEGLSHGAQKIHAVLLTLSREGAEGITVHELATLAKASTADVEGWLGEIRRMEMPLVYLTKILGVIHEEPEGGAR